MEMTMRPMTAMEQMYCYTQSQQIMATTGCIGHLRGDLDSTGEQFFSLTKISVPCWKAGEHYPTTAGRILKPGS